MSSTAFAWIPAVYLVLINAAGFILMGTDKNRAIQNARRIPEKVFFLLSALGGSAGCMAGMYVFHHKTRHWYFVLFIPLILAAQIILAMFLIIL